MAWVTGCSWHVRAYHRPRRGSTAPAWARSRGGPSGPCSRRAPCGRSCCNRWRSRNGASCRRRGSRCTGWFLSACSAVKAIALRVRLIVGLGDVLRPRPVAVLALVARQVRRLLLGGPARGVFEPGRVAGDAFRVIDRIRLGVLLQRLEGMGVLRRGPFHVGIGVAGLAVLGPDEGRARARLGVVMFRVAFDDADDPERVAEFVLDQLLHGRRRAVEFLVQVDGEIAEPLRLLGIEAEDPDVLALPPDAHQHRLVVVEHVGVVLEHVVVIRRRDDDVEAGIGLGQPLGQRGGPLDHQDLVVALGLEVRQHARQHLIGPLDLREDDVLVGIG